MYHHISTSPGMITVSPDHFAAQMAYLAQAGYRTVGAKQLSAYLAGASLPAKSLVTKDIASWHDFSGYWL
jgi:hypothetical protein